MIYLKLLGALTVAVGGALLGQARTAGEKESSTLLADLCTALGAMADEISALQTPLPQLMSRLSGEKRPAAPFFAAVLEKMNEMPLAGAWQSAAAQLALSDTEREMLKAVTSGLGRFDALAQSAELRLAASRLDKCLALRREKMQREGKMPAALGACLGAMCAIALF